MLKTSWHLCSGVTPEVKQHAEYISEKGDYRVVVPDLYRGKTGVDAEEASHVSSTPHRHSA